jgi:hypothetical protein
MPLGLTAVVLGSIGLLLFILPILAIPISACGLLLGAVGVPLAIWRGAGDVRLLLAAIVVCGASLGIGAAIQFAPGGYVPLPAEPPHLPLQRPRLFVAPPAAFPVAPVEPEHADVASGA